MTTLQRKTDNIFLIFLHAKAGASTCKSYSCTGQQCFPMTISLNVGSFSDWYHKVSSCRLQNRAWKGVISTPCFWGMSGIQALNMTHVLSICLSYWDGEGVDKEDESHGWGRSNADSWKPTEVVKKPPHLQYVQNPLHWYLRNRTASVSLDSPGITSSFCSLYCT